MYATKFELRCGGFAVFLTVAAMFVEAIDLIFFHYESR
jgi:hypothetical protein